MDKKRNTNKTIAEDTLQIMKQGYFVSPQNVRIDIKQALDTSVDNTICYSPEMTDILTDQDWNGDVNTAISVTNESTFNCVRRLLKEENDNVLCLNFASARNPGGGFLGGSQAQEESIARASGLYPTLTKCEAYYLTNRNMKSCFYSDYMIYSPDVPIFKDEYGKCIETFKKVSVITAPAVNTGVVKNREPERMAEIEIVMKRRISKVLAISAKHNYKVLVLGAWGCGVFQNDPNQIAKYFKEVINEKYKGQFEKIVFAIYARNERFITPFLKEFE